MKPVNQNAFTDGTGNCFSACLASILELSIDEVPNFVKDSKGQTFKMWDAVAKWINTKGYGIIHIPTKLSNCFFIGMDGCWAIGTVDSQNIPDVDHGVVIGWKKSGRWSNVYIAHDVNPNNKQIYKFDDIKAIELLIKRD